MKKVVFDSGQRLPIKLWLDNVEEGALEQAKNLSNLFFAFKHVALMPDAHLGYGMPIGGVLATKGVVVVNAVGVDIGCGVRALETNLTEITDLELRTILGEVRKVIPVGFNRHKEPQAWSGFDSVPDVEVIMKELLAVPFQLATLGSGNHFLEIQRDERGKIWIMVHSGSRNIGLKVAKYYHETAKRLCGAWGSEIPNPDLAFLPVYSEECQEYLRAMEFCLAFAKENRALIVCRVLEVMRRVLDTSFEHVSEMDVHHNYCVMENHFGENVWVHRKGAIRAREGDVGVIPGSMGTPSFITRGLGNPQSFNSSSHGAGRRMGRKEAIRSLNLEEEQKKMEGVVHGLRNASDLDEAPGAYKDIFEVMRNQEDLTCVVHTLQPLAVIKG